MRPGIRTAGASPVGSEGLVGLALHYQSNMDALYVYVVPWSVFPIVPSYPHI